MADRTGEFCDGFKEDCLDLIKSVVAHKSLDFRYFCDEWKRMGFHYVFMWVDTMWLDYFCLTLCVCLRLQCTHVSLRIGAVHRKLFFDAEKIVDRFALDDRTCRLSVSHVCNVFQATDQRLWQISIHNGRLDSDENILRWNQQWWRRIFAGTDDILAFMASQCISIRRMRSGPRIDSE